MHIVLASSCDCKPWSSLLSPLSSPASFHELSKPQDVLSLFEAYLKDEDTLYFAIHLNGLHVLSVSLEDETTITYKYLLLT